MPPSPLARKIRSTIRLDPIGWASTCGVNLRPYQREIAHAVKDSIVHKRGLTFVIILPRQSGKNELQSHLFAWLLFRAAPFGGRIVSVSPTFKPQTLNNMDRVRHSLDACLGSRGRWEPSSGYMFRLGKARLQFFSGESTASVVGATADLLLSVDEAQDIDPAKFDKDFDPMTASSNATRLFWGTAWTSSTLLERQRRLALEAEKKDGIRRLFFYTAEHVRRLVPAYGDHVDRVISEKGRNHPLVRSQYFCETLDAQSGMFNASRLALIFPSITAPSPFLPSEMGIAEHPGAQRREAGVGPLLSDGHERHVSVTRDGSDVSWMSYARRGSVAFLIDVAGMDESRLGLHASLLDEGLGNPGRDSTALSVVELDLSALETLPGPSYRVIARHAWTGENHLAVFGQLRSLADSWDPLYIVVDATGVGEGLWAMLDRAFPSRVIPVRFTRQEKSEIGWRFLSIIETGRFSAEPPSSRDQPHRQHESSLDSSYSDIVRLQYSRCISEILPGPGKTLRWGVPDGARAPDGSLIHDDFILADSLTAVLDRLEWHVHVFLPPVLVPGPYEYPAAEEWRT